MLADLTRTCREFKKLGNNITPGRYEMADKPANPIQTAEFSRPREVARLRPRGGENFDIRPNPAETAALAVLLGVTSLRDLHFTGRIEPEGKAGWVLDGQLKVRVVQPCVVTAVPVDTNIDQRVRRHFTPSTVLAVDIDPEEDPDIEPLGQVIDLGLIATEELALATPEYPRAQGAALDPAWSGDADDPFDDGQTRPFDALRALRDRLPD
jgi:uncharacterized metal-binding protein YceD (DUF177 family)